MSVFLPGQLHDLRVFADGAANQLPESCPRMPLAPQLEERSQVTRPES